MSRIIKVQQLTPGTRVRIEQPIARREGEWTAGIEGVVESVHDAQTGSWFARGEKERYVLRRVALRKPNGELSLLALEEKTRIHVLDNGASDKEA
jgi:hypothetical protein